MKKTVWLMFAAVMLSASAFADHDMSMYEVTITNITGGQTFTPILAATHGRGVSLYEVGEPASEALEMLAEGGNTMPLQEYLDSMPDQVHATTTTDGLLGPGESVSFEIGSSYGYFRISFAAMLLPTHDTFVAAGSVSLPVSETTFMVPAYDAGTELNDELCENIPGPQCGGAAISEESGEGFVHVASGIHGIGDLDPEVYDWRNPVAKVTIRRVW